MSPKRSEVQGADRRELLSLERRTAPIRSGGGDLRVHLAYPNTYWIAMSNLGFQAVYGLFGKEAGVSVERVFLPEDFESEKAQRSTWRTFETERPIADCDVLAFSLS